MAGTLLAMRSMHQLSDDAAISYTLARAAPGAQTGKLALKRLELASLRAHALQLRVDQVVYLLARRAALAGKDEQAAHVRKRHIEMPAVPDELQALHGFAAVYAISRSGSRWPRNQPFALVVANGGAINTGLPA